MQQLFYAPMNICTCVFSGFVKKENKKQFSNHKNEQSHIRKVLRIPNSKTIWVGNREEKHEKLSPFSPHLTFKLGFIILPEEL